ncbi:hypothetical protein [Chryseobacterium wanjuense]
MEKLSDFTQNNTDKSPIIYAAYSAQKNPVYIQIKKGKSHKNFSDEELKNIFNESEQSRLNLTNRVQLKTPDSDLNNFGANLAVAADGIWESPTYLHGAVAWRMRLNAWRGAYVADVLSWHDRAKEHFESYANSQVLKPDFAPVEMDTLLHLARHKESMGTSVFSSGYISRNPNDNTKPHHYDMNLVFFDQMFTHFNYTGDLEFLKKMWPTLVRHMDWEKEISNAASFMMHMPRFGQVMHCNILAERLRILRRIITEPTMKWQNWRNSLVKIPNLMKKKLKVF